jgi:hypothetical protein
MKTYNKSKYSENFLCLKEKKLIVNFYIKKIRRIRKHKKKYKSNKNLHSYGIVIRATIIRGAKNVADIRRMAETD